MIYEKKRPQSKQEVAYQKIRGAIVNGTLASDTVLVENDLCHVLGFSKTPIREALRRLSTEGLVESIPEKGTFVKRITLDEAVEIFDNREVIEGMCARLFTMQKFKDANDELILLMDEWKHAIENKNHEKCIECDMRFHELVIQGSGNQIAHNFCDTLIIRIRMCARRTKDDMQLNIDSYNQHYEIYLHMINGEAELAEQSMKKHIRIVKDYHIKHCARALR